MLELVPSEAKVVIGTESEGQVIALHAERCNWFLPVTAGLPCLIKWSHRGELQHGHIEAVDGSNVTVRFNTPQFGIAPGQAVVFYQDELVLGGGWIQSTERLSR